MKRKKRRCLMSKMMFLLMLVLVFANGKAVGQQNRISIRFENQTLEKVLDSLKERTSYEFLYNDEEVRQVTGITRNFTNASIEDILTACLSGTNYSYRIVNNIIVITPEKSAGNEEAGITLRGQVLDDQGQPLAGATIQIKGTSFGIASDIDGNFKLEITRKEKMVLLVSFIGMEPQEVEVDKIKDLKKELVVRLKSLVTEVDEVVVTGYTTVKRSSFTGSAVTVNRDELLRVSQTNVLAALQTFDPSFRVMRNNEFGSDPNIVPEIYIRGRSGIGVKELDPNYTSKSNLIHNPNLPVFIMDGFEVTVEKVYDMDPNRIETMTILKDAAATALYGSRAANGVVVITTVAPKPGEIRISYSLTGSASFPDLHDYNLANAAEKLEIELLSGVYDAETPDQLQGSIYDYNKRLARIKEGVDTDWLALPLRNVFKHKHSVYIEGGNNDLRYGLSLSYNRDGGVMKSSHRNRSGISFFVDYRIKNLQIKNEVSYNYTKAKESPYGTFSDYVYPQPYDRPYDENGVLVKQLELSTKNYNKINNPLYESTLGNYDFSVYNEFTENLDVYWRLLENSLTLRGQVGIIKKYTKGERFIDPLSHNVTRLRSEDPSLAGDLYLTQGDISTWDAKLMVYYAKNINQHSINFSGGINVMGEKTYSYYTHYRGFPSGELSSPNYASEVKEKPSRSEVISRLFGVLANLNYTYDDTYFLDGSIRFDGSSKFGKDQKWAPFWSLGAGINIHKYEFMQSQSFLNELRLKISYGETGKTNFEPYLSKTMYGVLADDWYATGYGAMMKAMGNRKLSWETTQILNAGLDLILWKDKINLNAAYYKKTTIDMVSSVTIPSSTGFTSYSDNLGEIINEGFEVNFRANVLKTKDFFLSVSGNIARNNETMGKLSESMKDYNRSVEKYYEVDYSESDMTIYAKPLRRYEDGASTRSIWGMQSRGIDPTTGKEIYVNRDGSITYTWNPAEHVVLGNEEPKANGSFSFYATYKGFTLNASFSYLFGGQIYNQTLVNNVENARVSEANVDKRVLTDRWKQPGDVTPLKDIRDWNEVTKPTSRFVQDNNELSLNSLTLGYDFDPESIRKIGLKLLRLEVQTNDIARWSTVRMERGTSYPFARQINFTLRANF